MMFPSVSALELRGCWDTRIVRTIALPAHISSLGLLLPLETYRVQLAAPLAHVSLTSPDAHAVPLLRLSRDTLVSLNLHTSGDIALGARFGFRNEARMKGRRELSSYLYVLLLILRAISAPGGPGSHMHSASEHFMSLHSIALVTPPSDPHAFDTLVPFFATHATQLRSLQLDPYLPIGFVDQIARLPFPCLSHISLCAYDISSATLEAFIANAPRLQNFKILCNERAFSAPPPTLAALLNLEINRSVARDPRSFPANLAHLRRVDISLDLWDSKPPLLPAISTRVSRFEDRPQFQDVWTLLHNNAFPNLRRLLLSHVHSGAKSATLQLPSLEVLRVEATADLDTTLATLRVFVRQCPALREIDFSLPAEVLRDYSDLFAFLSEAEAAGVERMQVHGMDVALHITLVEWARRHCLLRLTPQMHSNMVQRTMYYVE